VWHDPRCERERSHRSVNSSGRHLLSFRGRITAEVELDNQMLDASFEPKSTCSPKARLSGHELAAARFNIDYFKRIVSCEFCAEAMLRFGFLRTVVFARWRNC
jgi:hypothetical protein